METEDGSMYYAAGNDYLTFEAALNAAKVAQAKYPTQTRKVYKCVAEVRPAEAVIVDHRRGLED